MILFGAGEKSGLAWEVSQKLGSPLGKCEVKKFPDDELYVRVTSKVKGETCAVVKTVRSSDDLVELLLLLSALRDSGARAVHTVTPYLAYMRQDKQFNPGEALSAKTILQIIDELSDDVTTINCHFLGGAGDFIYEKVRLRNLDATPLLAGYFKSKVRNPIVVAPDKGSVAYAKHAAQMLDCPFNHLSKKRVSGEQVIIKEKNLDVKGMDVLMLDDIISTGGTIAKAAAVVRGWKPGSVNVGCVHGLFLNGVQQFKGAADRIVATNSIPSAVSKVSLADLIVADLKK